MRRESAVRTTSSITFAYNPTTQPINPRLLAEEDRIAAAEEEQAALKANNVPAPLRSAPAAMGRETQSLTMMVTPRIIIQEEEEEKLGVDDT